MKILIIDDDINFISKILNKYSNENHSFAIADSLDRAKHIIKYNDFDIIITNFRIPGGDSLKFKQEFKNSNIKFLFISNFDTDLQYIKKNGERCYFKYELDNFLRIDLNNV